MRKALLSLLLLCAPLHADEDSFREKFADPATRMDSLAELVPGSQEAYFHTALAHQLAGRQAEFQAVMAEWKAAAERKEDPVPDSDMATLANRDLFLRYAKNPQAVLPEIIRRYDLKLGDARPDAAAAAESLPTRIAPALIAEAAFEKAAAEKSTAAPYLLYTGTRLLRELDGVGKFDEAEVRWFIEHLGRGDLPGVVPLISRALVLDPPPPFGSIALRDKLSTTQLDALLKLRPQLLADEAFAVSYLEKFLPGAETDFTREPQALAAHLQRCRDFVITLPPAVNSLKAHVLYHHLRLQAEAGNFPKADFLAYLALPQHDGVLRVEKDSRDPFVQLDSDFSSATTCPPIRNDEALIRSYLDHLLAETDSAADYAPFIGKKQLTEIHATARLLAGAEPQRWGKLLDPSAFRDLQEKARISFSPGSPLLLDADAAVTLALDLKNTPDLLIRIYELDLPGQLARDGKEPQVTIDLDGLVPHHERHVKFPQAPLRLHQESIPLPELAGPGAWLVDIVSGNVSARALIRKGRLIPYTEQGAASQTVRVFDEKGHILTGASVMLGGETFAADPSGRILIPDSANQPPTGGIIQAGKLAAWLQVSSRADSLALDAAFHLDREQLLADQETNLHLRLRLTDHGHELPLDRIKDPALVLKAELSGGITTERVIAENLKLTPLMDIPFQIPADLLKLTLTLRGTVTPPAGGDAVKLARDEVFTLNDNLRAAQIGGIFLSPTASGHRLELRGRNGEPLPSHPLSVFLKREGYQQPIQIGLRTDAQGRVDLGTLDGIAQLSVIGEGFAKAQYSPAARHRQPPGTIQIAAGQEIRLPLELAATLPDRLHLSLLETKDAKLLRDHFDKIRIEAGELVIRGLPAGDFMFRQGSHQTTIRVSGGLERDGLLVSSSRILPISVPVQPVITAASAEAGELKIQLRGHDAGTRITLIGRRFQESAWDPGKAIYPFPQPRGPIDEPGFTACEFLTERTLDDEMRYILDRRATKTFPGSMLPRPGLLLHRWTEEDLKQDTQTGQEGSSGHTTSAPIFFGMKGGAYADRSRKRSPSGLDSTRDFLAAPAVLRFELAPAADGSLKFPLADFKHSQFIEITATADSAADALLLPLPANDAPLRDRRIARPLDPQAHHLATRSAAVLAKGAQASIENLLDAEWRAFTTLTEAHQFLYGITQDDRLREFAFLTDWPDLPEAKKLELLATHPCNELHLFLARKDPAFFEKHVKPLLAQKPEPHFIDDYLLARDLKNYLRPYAWDRLNAAEKALLAQALPEARARISRALTERWQLEAPTPDLETTLFTQTLRGSDLATRDSLGLARKDYSPAQEESSGLAYVTQKLKQIIIPQIDFEDTTLEEAINFLRLRSVELDTLELDPAKKGVNIVIRRPRSTDGSAPDPGELRIRQLRVKNVPLTVALKYICDQTRLRFKVDDFAVTLAPQTESGEDLFTRTFRVLPDFVDSLDSGGGGASAPNDPFAPSSDSNRKTLSARPPISELLRKAGIILPDGASATLDANGTLHVTASPAELDKIAQLTAAAAFSAPAAPAAPADPEVLGRGDLEPPRLSRTAPASTVRRITSATPSPPENHSSRSTTSGWISPPGMAKGLSSPPISTPATTMPMRHSSASRCWICPSKQTARRSP